MSDPSSSTLPGSVIGGVSRFLGFRYDAPGTVRLAIRDELLNPGGLLSGAVSCALVDHAMASALWAQRAEGEAIATLSINYLQTARAGEIVCHAQLDRRNRTAATLRATVETEDGLPLTTAIGSFSIFQARC